MKKKYKNPSIISSNDEDELSEEEREQNELEEYDLMDDDDF